MSDSMYPYTYRLGWARVSMARFKRLTIRSARLRLVFVSKGFARGWA